MNQRPDRAIRQRQRLQEAHQRTLLVTKRLQGVAQPQMEPRGRLGRVRSQAKGVRGFGVARANELIAAHCLEQATDSGTGDARARALDDRMLEQVLQRLDPGELGDQHFDAVQPAIFLPVEAVGVGFAGEHAGDRLHLVRGAPRRDARLQPIAVERGIIALGPVLRAVERRVEDPATGDRRDPFDALGLHERDRLSAFDAPTRQPALVQKIEFINIKEALPGVLEPLGGGAPGPGVEAAEFEKVQLVMDGVREELGEIGG